MRRLQPSQVFLALLGRLTPRRGGRFLLLGSHVSGKTPESLLLQEHLHRKTPLIVVVCVELFKGQTVGRTRWIEETHRSADLFSQ